MIFISVSIYQLCSANSALSKYFVRGIIVISKGYLRDQRSLVTCVTDGGRRIPFRIFFIFMWSVFGNLNKLQFAKLDIDQQQTATNFHFTKTIHIPQIFEKYGYVCDKNVTCVTSWKILAKWIRFITFWVHIMKSFDGKSFISTIFANP